MLDRRRFVKCLAATGIGTATLHRAIATRVQEQSADEITAEMIKDAEWIAGVELSEEQRDELARSANRSAGDWATLREHAIDYFELPAVHFAPLNDNRQQTPPDRSCHAVETAAPQVPSNDEELAFLPVTELAALIRTRKISSRELTEVYLQRLKKFDPMLKCVVNLTESLALEQAERADREIAMGRYRGPLHGIPWGAKDLMSVPGYPTTWGIPQFRERQTDDIATVYQRLTEAGAVLVAKLSLGAIAMGDRWFGGKTRSPWNPQIGSSGSSAGSASAVVAGLVGFAIGTETLGSIVSPCRRCGASGLRPTFGRVSRAGCMPLSWTMDKIGPITRCVDDAALVFGAIHGSDGLDPTVLNKPFGWPPRRDVRGLRVGYVSSRRGDDDREDLTNVRKLGVELVQVELPQMEGIRTLASIIDIEGASVFEAMLNRNETEGWNAWPAIFRRAQFVSAVDYLRLMRLRRQLMFQMETTMRSIDVLVNARDLFITNLTGHPSVVLPREIREEEDEYTPVTDLFTGKLFGEEDLLALAHAYQNQVAGHLQRPPLAKFLQRFEQQQADEP